MRPPQPTTEYPASCQRAARLISEQQAVLLDRWENAVRSRLPAARHQETLLLRNNLLLFLDVVATRLANPADGHGTQKGEAAEANRSHGRLRATLAGYSVEQLVEEYIILRATITELLKEHDLLDHAVLEIVMAVNEQAVLSAVQEFVDSLQNLRQKAVSMLMHDIRNPLNVITITAELVKAKTPEHVGTMDRILTNSEKIDRMVGELLDAVRLQAGQGVELRRKSCELSHVLQVAVESAQLTYPGVIVAHLPEYPIHGLFDPAAISRAVENLLANAVKYGLPEGPVTITMQLLDDVVYIAVHNRGDPIAAQDSARIFIAFQRASKPDNRHGWGLGLAYVKAVADGHNGTVDVASSWEQGTTFTLRLPCKPDSPAV